MSTLKRRALIALGCLVALALAFSAGRFAAPAKVHVVTVVDTQVIKVEAKAKVASRNRQVDRKVERVTTPDGTVTETITDKSRVTAMTNEVTTSETAATSSVKTEKVQVNDYPRLTVLVLAGYSHNPGVQLIPQAGPLAVGAMVNYRIAGPLTVGVGALSTGTVFAGAGAQF